MTIHDCLLSPGLPLFFFGGVSVRCCSVQNFISAVQVPSTRGMDGLEHKLDHMCDIQQL